MMTISFKWKEKSKGEYPHQFKPILILENRNDELQITRAIFSSTQGYIEHTTARRISYFDLWIYEKDLFYNMEKPVNQIEGYFVTDPNFIVNLRISTPNPGPIDVETGELITE